MSWQQQAACRGLDPAIFFPGRGDTPSVRRALDVCDGCTVRAECLAYAVDNGELAGIWGGQTQRQRRLTRARNARPGPRPRRPERGDAFALFAEGLTTGAVSRRLNVPYQTVRSWRKIAEGRTVTVGPEGVEGE